MRGPDDPGTGLARALGRECLQWECGNPRDAVALSETSIPGTPPSLPWVQLIAMLASSEQ